MVFTMAHLPLPGIRTSSGLAGVWGWMSPGHGWALGPWGLRSPPTRWASRSNIWDIWGGSINGSTLKMNGEWKIRNIILLDSDCSLIWDDLGPILGNPNMGKSVNIICRWRCLAGNILIGRRSSTPWWILGGYHYLWIYLFRAWTRGKWPSNYLPGNGQKMKHIYR